MMIRPLYRFVPALCLAIAMLCPSAWAQLGEVNLQFEDSEGPADATIIVPVQLVSLVGASTVFFRVDTDDTALELMDVFPGASTLSAGKEVSVGTDTMDRPTVLITDFGGGLDVIPNGELVFLIFRSASGLGVGTEIDVTGAEPSAAAPSGAMLTTTAFGATVDIVACSAPARPDFLAASDGTLSDRVALGWLPVAGASEYVVFRSEFNNFASASLIANVETTTYDDTTAGAAMVAMGGCRGQALPQFEAYFYWVVAVNSCGISPPSPVDSGFRGLEPAKSVESPLSASFGPVLLLLAAGAGWAARRYPRVL